jgi:hypothetical protein
VYTKHCYWDVFFFLSFKFISFNSPFWYSAHILPTAWCNHHYRKNTDWGCLRTGCWGQYSELRGMKWQGAGENCMTRSCMVCTLCFHSYSNGQETFSLYGVQTFITVFPKACQWVLSLARLIYSTSTSVISARYILILSSKHTKYHKQYLPLRLYPCWTTERYYRDDINARQHPTPRIEETVTDFLIFPGISVCTIFKVCVCGKRWGVSQQRKATALKGHKSL